MDRQTRHLCVQGTLKTASVKKYMVLRPAYPWAPWTMVEEHHPQHPSPLTLKKALITVEIYAKNEQQEEPKCLDLYNQGGIDNQHIYV